MSVALAQEQTGAVFAAAERAARAAGVHDVEVTTVISEDALTRFANNAIHQNVAERNADASIRVVDDGRTARVTTNHLDEDGVRRATEQAIAIARALEPDPDLLALAEYPPAPGVSRYFDGTADCSSAERARAVAGGIRLIEAAGQVAAGIYRTAAYAHSILNSRGLRQLHVGTMAAASITAIAADSSGWAKASSPDLRTFSLEHLARIARDKAARSASPRELPPGRYTVILEPAAVLDLAGQLFHDFSATAVEDRRSFLNDRMGKRVFGENITVRDDVYHPLQTGPTFDGEGVPRQTLCLIEKGVPASLPYSRPAARRASTEPTGHGFPVPNDIGEMPLNIVMEGGEMTPDQMIEGTARGILVTRFWYIREVDPYEKIMTGMTRDGTFLIEDGRIVCGVRNFRFNQSLIELLNNVALLGPAVRAAGEEAHDMVVPALKVNDFNFTEVTRF